MSYRQERETSSQHKDSEYMHKRAGDFKDWNMYKCFLDDQGLLNFDLTYTRVNWRAYIERK
jgi:hypothetical protein